MIRTFLEEAFSVLTKPLLFMDEHSDVSQSASKTEAERHFPKMPYPRELYSQVALGLKIPSSSSLFIFVSLFKNLPDLFMPSGYPCCPGHNDGFKYSSNSWRVSRFPSGDPIGP